LIAFPEMVSTPTSGQPCWPGDAAARVIWLLRIMPNAAIESAFEKVQQGDLAFHKAAKDVRLHDAGP
jgi:hypothetical protein